MVMLVHRGFLLQKDFLSVRASILLVLLLIIMIYKSLKGESWM